MDPINWKEKLSSKKFWCALIACIAAVGAAFGLSDGSVEKITSIIGAFATLIIYILVEGSIDVKRVEAEVLSAEPTEGIEAYTPQVIVNALRDAFNITDACMSADVPREVGEHTSLDDGTPVVITGVGLAQIEGPGMYTLQEDGTYIRFVYATPEIVPGVVG